MPEAAAIDSAATIKTGFLPSGALGVIGTPLREKKRT
jgi:hypothetical protein